MSILSNKTTIYQIQTADSVSPSIANAPHGNIETNIDSIRAYLNSAITGHFEQDLSTTTGLTFGYRAGAIRNGTTIAVVNAGTIVLTASSTNYLEIDNAGIVSANTTSFTTGKIPLWLVTTNVSSLTSVIDKRVLISFVNASDISNIPAGNIASTNVQSAINELDTEKAALSGATFTGIISATNLSGSNTGDQTITLTGDVTGGGTGSFATTLATVPVAKGGTGNTSTTAYAVLCGGTTTTGAHQAIASVGTAGQILTSNGAAALPTFQNPTGVPTLAGAQALSGTVVQYTGLPVNLKRIMISITTMATNGSSLPLIQIGPSGGFETTGYAGSSQIVNTAGLWVGTGAALGYAWASTYNLSGSIVLTLLNATTNLWVVSGTLGRHDGAAIHMTGGYKALAGTLNQIRLIMTNGTDAFTAGSVNITYE